MGSRLLSLSHPSNDSSPLKLSNMEAIKKKMQAMKVEKDNACDRVDASEEQCKAAKLRASKAEDEVDELITKARQLETELDLTTEKLGIATLQLEEKEKQLSATELEMALRRTLRRPRRRWWLPLPSLTRLPLPQTTLSAPRRFSRARPKRTRRGSPFSRRSSRRQGRRL